MTLVTAKAKKIATDAPSEDTSRWTWRAGNNQPGGRRERKAASLGQVFLKKIIPELNARVEDIHELNIPSFKIKIQSNTDPARRNPVGRRPAN